MKYFRRMISLFLAVFLLLPPAGALAASGASFSDMPSWHWAYQTVRQASQIGLIKGVSKNAFGTGREVTRAEYATMLCRLMDWELISPEEGSFDDNRDKSAWYYSAIETAYARGALLKLGASCGVNEPVSREEMAMMTVRALGFASLAGTAQDECRFTDVSTNRGYIALADRMGVITGVNKWTFSPKSPCTREQAAAVLLRVYDRLHADIRQGDAKDMPAGTKAVWAESLAGTEGPVPLSPRAGLESVYAAAAQAGAGGAVALHTTPCAQTVSADGAVSEIIPLTSAELDALLADEAAQSYRSARYGSSYLIRTGADGLSTVVWYETQEDLAAKVELCRLMGVSAVYFGI